MSIIYSQSRSNTMSRNAFMACTGVLTLYSLGVTAAFANFALVTKFNPSTLLMIGLTVLPFLGIFIASRQSTFFKVFGLHMIIIPFGLTLGPALAAHTSLPHGAETVFQSLVLTGCGTGIMTLLATLYPRFFSAIGGILFAGLLGL